MLARAADPSQDAAHLASEAKRAQSAGQLVKAYILFGEAATKDPHNSAYKRSHEVLAPLVQLLTKAEIAAAMESSNAPPAEPAGKNPFSPAEDLLSANRDLQPLPHIKAKHLSAKFDVRADVKELFKSVTAVYGVQTIFDRDLPSQTVQFTFDSADFPTAMEALTASTGTFVFPITDHTIYVAQDNVPKRLEVEPHTLVTLNLPEAMNQQSLVEAAQAVKSTLGIRSMAWDTTNHEIVIADTTSRARVAKSLLEALILPKGQVRIEVQIISLMKDVNYHYGIAFPTSYSIWDFGHFGAFK